MRRAMFLWPALVCGWSAVAAAYDFEVSATTVGQGDQIRRFEGDGVVLLNRRRVTQMLGLRLFNFLPPADPGSGKPVARLALVGNMRFDTHFGDFANARDENGVVVIPELEDDQLDVLLLYIEGKDFLRGTTDFRLGRQVSEDLLDWVAFDGAEVFFHPPIYVGFEGFAGLQVRGQDPLSSPAMDLDGTSSTILSDEMEVASPMFGGAVQTHGLRDVQVRSAYRRSFSSAPIVVADSMGEQRSETFDGIDEEKVSFSARGRVLDAAYPYAGLRYNFLVARSDFVEGGMRVQVHPRHAVTPAYVQVVPTFEGDSIFNVFSIEPYQEGSLTYDLQWLRRMRTSVKYLVRQFHNTAEGELKTTAVLHHGAGWGARLDFDDGFIRLEGRFDSGYGGLTAGSSVAGVWNTLRDRLALEGRVTALRYESDDALRDERFRRDLWTFGLQGGARYRLCEGAAVHLLVEENTNALYRSYFRMLGLLDLAYQP